MKILRVIVGIIWKISFIMVFVSTMIVLYPLFYTLLLNKQTFPIAFKLKRYWAKLMLAIVGVFTRVYAKFDLRKINSPVIYCANHGSYLDILSAYIVIPNYFVSMAKKELGSVPLFNVFFKNMNILVDRQSIRGSHRAFVSAAKQIDEGVSIFLFPEGGILNNRGELCRFKNGAFKLAIEKQIPIVPITFLNNWKLFQNGVLTRTFARPGLSRVIVNKPIDTKGLTLDDLVYLRQKVHGVIEGDLEEYNRK